MLLSMELKVVLRMELSEFLKSGRIAKKSDGRLDLVPRESLVRYPEIFMDINKIISEVF
mgnify:CR=1 FL=1